MFTSQNPVNHKNISPVLKSHKGHHLRSQVKIGDEGECIFCREHQRTMVKFQEHVLITYI